MSCQLVHAPPPREVIDSWSRAMTRLFPWCDWSDPLANGTVSPLQEGVGAGAVPAPCRAVQHEGEEHQKGPLSHPEDQPEPGAAR